MADVPEDVILPVSQPEKRSDELEKRWNEYSDVPWQKRDPSPGPPVGEPPTNQELAPNSPPPQTGTSRIQHTESASSPEINKLPPPGEDYPSSSGESFLSDHGSTMSSEDYHASDEGGPGPSKSYSDSFSKTDIIGVGSNGDGSPESTKSYPPWNRPELASNKGGPWSTKSYPPSDGPGPDLASNEGGPVSKMVSTGPVLEPIPGWNPHDWSESSPEPEPKKKFMSKTKSFFNKLVYKFKFWPRGPRVL